MVAADFSGIADQQKKNIVVSMLKENKNLSDMNLNLPEFWKNKKEKLKQRYPGLTDKDLNFSLGKEMEMVERLGRKLGKSIKELLTIIVTL